MSTQVFLRILLLLIVLCSPFFASKESASQEAQWSKEATTLAYKTGTRRIEILSPDGMKAAVIDGVALDVVMEGKRLPGIEDAGVSTLAELAWAPDSIAFFVTESYGGWVGDWHVRVFVIEDGKAHRMAITNEVVKSFKKHYRCKEPQDPNIGAVKWLNGSTKLLIVAEVPPHSNCPEMGKLRGYIVEIPTGKIVEQFDEKKLRADWGQYLGKRLSHKQKK